MKKILFLLLLVSTVALGQGRPDKELCFGEFDDDGEDSPPTCTGADSEEVLELKNEFNKLAQELRQAIHTQRDFNASAVIARRNGFNVEIARLETIRDILDNQDLRDKFQAKINKLVSNRDEADSTDPGSARDNASKLGPVVYTLNQQLSDIEAALASLP